MKQKIVKRPVYCRPEDLEKCKKDLKARGVKVLSLKKMPLRKKKEVKRARKLCWLPANVSRKIFRKRMDVVLLNTEFVIIKKEKPAKVKPVKVQKEKAVNARNEKIEKEKDHEYILLNAKLEQCNKEINATRKARNCFVDMIVWGAIFFNIGVLAALAYVLKIFPQLYVVIGAGVVGIPGLFMLVIGMVYYPNYKNKYSIGVKNRILALDELQDRKENIEKDIRDYRKNRALAEKQLLNDKKQAAKEREDKMEAARQEKKLAVEKSKLNKKADKLSKKNKKRVLKQEKKINKKASKKAKKEAKRNRKVAAKQSKKTAKVAKKEAKRNKNVAAKQTKKTTKVAKKQAKKNKKVAAKQSKKTTKVAKKQTKKSRKVSKKQSKRRK